MIETMEKTNTQQVDEFVAEEAPYLAKPVEFSRWCGQDPGINTLKEVAKVLKHVGNGHETCTVSVDRISRFNMVYHFHGVDLEALKLIELAMSDAWLDVESRRLRVGTKHVTYQMFMEQDYSVTIGSEETGFAFPLTIQLNAWTSLDDDDAHHELCGIDWPRLDCECEPTIDYSKTLVIELKDAEDWQEIMVNWLQERDTPDKPG